MLKKAMAITTTLCALSAMCVAQPAQGGKKAAHAFQIQDNAFSYIYSDSMRDPYTTKADDPTKPQNIVKNGVDFNHIDIGSKFGDNMFNAEFLVSSKADAASTAYYHDATQSGALDAYYTYRHNMPFNRLFNTNKFNFGPVKDVYGWFGFDWGSKNNDGANMKREPMAGLGVSIKVPNRGYWNVYAGWTREWNQEGADVTSYLYTTDYQTYYTYSEAVAQNPYNPYYIYSFTAVPNKWGQPMVYAQEGTFQTSWGIPFSLGKAFMSFEGFGVLNTSKGYGALTLQSYKDPSLASSWTRAGTKPELILRPQILYNFGRLFGPGHNWQIGAGYEYWNNMFGVDHHIHNEYTNSTSLQNAPFLDLTIHL
jgi:hypothetical protein